jgi:hypothetical protein
MTPGTGLCRPDDVERLARAIRGSELGAPIDANASLPELRARVK